MPVDHSKSQPLDDKLSLKGAWSTDVASGVARSFFGEVAICYVFPVLWMTSCLHILVRHGVAKRASTESE